MYLHIASATLSRARGIAASNHSVGRILDMQQASESNLDVVVLGSALVELTPGIAGRSLEDAEWFTPMPGGSGANFAVAMAALGARVGFMSRVGQDELGRWLIKRLAAHGIDTDLIKPVSGHLTPVSFCWADRSGHKTFYFYRAPEFSDPMATLDTATIDDQEILRAKIFDFTEAAVRAEPVRGAALYAANIAREAGRTVCYAVNYRRNSWSEPLDVIRRIQKQAIAAADLVLMNQQEACFIFQTDDASQALAAAQALGPSAVVFTAGEGSILLASGSQHATIPSFSVDVQYDVGAGDTFHAGFIVAYLHGLSVPQAARWAAAAGALKISQPASAPPPSSQQVEAFIADHS